MVTNFTRVCPQNVNFYEVESVNEGGQVVKKKAKTTQLVNNPLLLYSIFIAFGQCIFNVSGPTIFEGHKVKNFPIEENSLRVQIFKVSVVSEILLAGSSLLLANKSRLKLSLPHSTFIRFVEQILSSSACLSVYDVTLVLINQTFAKEIMRKCISTLQQLLRILAQQQGQATLLLLLFKSKGKQ